VRLVPCSRACTRVRLTHGHRRDRTHGSELELHLNRTLRAALVALLIVPLTLAGAVAPALAATPVPRVALIVGPVGSLTSTYRSLANAAAAEAQAAGAEVVKVYSPNATWSAVKHATNGASIVVYLGHGNGWPSRYRGELYPPTQNGFGLNPVAGVDDVAHQYFGEASVEDLKLADNAVVILSHLCYASGNTESGLPEGTRDQAIQRVDNFAAGFIRAGATAVVAEAHLGPAYYVRQLLRTQLSIERIWRASPAAKGNTFTATSQRSAGFTESLDPDQSSGGYYRSLVSRGVTASQVRSGARGTTSGVVSQPPSEPSLASLNIRFGTLKLRDLPISDSHTVLTLPVANRGAKLIPSGARVGIRWDPILLDAVSSAGDTPSSTSDASPPTIDSSPAPDGSATPDASPDAGSQGSDTLSVDLIAPEQLGAVVEVGRVRRSGNALRVEVAYPSAPGLYRLVPSLHTPSGVAYDTATQALLTPVLVRVGGPIAAAYGAPASVTMAAGTVNSLQVRVVNAGSEAWDAPSDEPPSGADALLYWLRTSRAPATLVGTWVSAAGSDVTAPASAVLDAANAAPGGDATVDLSVTAPATPGDYLLLLDVLSPAVGALSSHGTEPALIRVTVSGTGAPSSPPLDQSSSAPAEPAVGSSSDGLQTQTGQPDATQPGASPSVDGAPGVTLPGVIGPVTSDPSHSPARTNNPAS
jgi:hypothetical protein